MFSVIPFNIERDRSIYQHQNEILPKDTQVYGIKLDKVNDIDYYFTFSYVSREKAWEIAKKLWYDGRNFYQASNRSDNLQTTLISKLE